MINFPHLKQQKCEKMQHTDMRCDVGCNSINNDINRAYMQNRLTNSQRYLVGLVGLVGLIG